MNFLSCKIILLIFCLHYSSLAQKKVEFEILYGTYTNDHYNRTFYAQERKWILKSEMLIYFIDATNTRFSDTLKLNTNDMDSIVKCINDNKLTISIIKNLEIGYLDKYEWTANIIGEIKLNDQKATFGIKTNSSTALDTDEDAERLMKLEGILYQIIDNHKR